MQQPVPFKVFVQAFEDGLAFNKRFPFIFFELWCFWIFLYVENVHSKQPIAFHTLFYPLKMCLGGCAGNEPVPFEVFMQAFEDGLGIAKRFHFIFFEL